MKSMRSVLGIPDVRRLIFVTTMSQLGDRLTHMLLITVIALVRPGRLMGYSEGALVFSLPTLLLCPVVGVLVDRWDRRRVLGITHLIQSGVLLVTPLVIRLTGSFVPFWVALFVFFGLDLFNNTAGPSLLPVLAGERRLVAANSAQLAFGRAATIVGMLAGGVLIAWVGWSAGLVINALTHLSAGVAAFAISPLRKATPRPGEPSIPVARELAGAAGRFLAEFAELLSLVSHNRRVAFVLASIVVSTFVSAASYTILIYLVQQVLGLGTAGVGALAGVLAFGMVAGAAGMSLLPEDVNRKRAICAFVLVHGLPFVIGRFHLSLPFIVVAALVSGAAYSGLGVLQNTMLQEEAEPGIRARVFSAREFITNATFIVSTLVIGLAGEVAPWRSLLLFIGLALVLLSLTGLVWSRNDR
ncbi:MAG: MFS transporter [Candidatus Eisenbacteria bacterium]|nr:MFS transporter [Candidatus Eisenbacteria bacterium]